MRSMNSTSGVACCFKPSATELGTIVGASGSQDSFRFIGAYLEYIPNLVTPEVHVLTTRRYQAEPCQKLYDREVAWIVTEA